MRRVELFLEDLLIFIFFFFQAEDGIRDYKVTGVQTCALPILDVSAFYMDIRDLQATVTAGSCSSRVIFNVPKSRSMGVEVELEAAPTRNFDFTVSGSYVDAKMLSTLTSTAKNGTVSIVSGIQDGARLPSVPKFKFAAAATYQWEV